MVCRMKQTKKENVDVGVKMKWETQNEEQQMCVK